MVSKTFLLSLAAALSLTATASAQQNGRYVAAQGLTPPTIAAGSVDAHMDNKPYSASYLSRQEGNLNRKNDVGLGEMIEKGFGDCDLVHQIVKDNAKKPSTGKFDEAIKNSEGVDPGTTADYEARGHNPDAAHWEGFCHLWAPAGLDPAAAFVVSMDKIYANVPFGIGDLKELTTWNYPQPNAVFIGKRNNGGDSKKDSEILDPTDLLTTFDTYVGPGKPGVVLDIDPSAEVWNQAIYSYKRETTALTGDDAKGGPKGSTAFLVKLNAQYAKEPPGHEFANRGDSYLIDLNWQMKVWTDAKGKIVKSEWVKDSSDPIPDFAWAPVGKNKGENFSRLQKIQKDGIAVKDIQSFCEGMQNLTKDSLGADGKKLAALLEAICPVLDQNHLADYIKKTAERTGIDASALDSALNPAGNS
jgi:hypothetical protein